MVQRYEFEIYHCNGGEVVASDDGEYVSYEDYERLKQEFRDYMVVKEKQIANLERALGAGETRYDCRRTRRRPQGTGRNFR
jgi:hypothetical protein